MGEHSQGLLQALQRHLSYMLGEGTEAEEAHIWKLPHPHSWVWEERSIDLLDMQSCPDGEFKYIFNYYDQGTASSVARALIDVFTIYGPPAILQPDNAKNMSKIATFPKARKVELDEHYVSNVIKHVKHLWPEVNMVRGNPRKSESNGGIERFHGVNLVRVGHWCVDNNCKHWSLGVRIICWR